MSKRIKIFVLIASSIGLVMFFTVFDFRNVKVGESVRPILKKMEDFLYLEAGKYNPEGDVLPDEIDDIIKNKLKKEIW